MTTSATKNGDYQASSKDGAHKSTHSSDSDGTCASAGACFPVGSSNMEIQDFVSYLAKEINITNMTVETNDGRRICATFDQVLPSCTSVPRNGQLASNADDDPSATLLVKDKSAREMSSEISGNNGDSGMVTITSPTRDIAKTIAMMGTEKTDSTRPMLNTPSFDACVFREWAMNYRNIHVLVKNSTIVAEVGSSLQKRNLQKGKGSPVSGSGVTSLPPKKRATVKAEEAIFESWNAMSALVDAATVAQREHEKIPPGMKGVGGSASTSVPATIATGLTHETATFKKKSTKRKPRKIIPEIKEYVEFTQKDVLFGRGGRSNHHPGNKTYRDIVTKKQNHYRGCDKNEKTKVAQGIVDYIQNVVGGRFLELDRDIKRWFLVPNVVARRKVGQALRENNTEEARAAKRAKYQGRLNSKKRNVAGTEDVPNGNSIGPMTTDSSSSSVVPGVAMNITNSNIGFPISTTEVSTNAFPIDDTESSNSVAV